MAGSGLATASSVLFGALALWFAGRLVVGRDVPDRIAALLHLLMSGAMLAMPYPWAPPAAVQVPVFTAGALWYIGLAVYRPAADADLGVGHPGHRGALGLRYHAAMLAAMAWMAVAMTPSTPGGAGHAAMTAAAAEPQPGWAVAVSDVLGAGFALAAVWLVVLVAREAVGPARRLPLADLVASALMAGGMSFSFLVLMHETL